MRIRHRMIGCGLAAMLVACGGTSSTDPVEGETAPETTTAATETAEADVTSPPPTAQQGADGLQDKQGNPIRLVPFDIDSVPLSNAALGELPFFSLPAGYDVINRPHERAYARFPFRLDDGLHWVEGRSWNALVGISRQDRDKTFSARELERNLEAVITEAGGRKVFEGPLQRDLYYGAQLEDEIGGGFIDGVNMSNANDTRVYVIRQADRNVWIQLALDSMSAGLVIVEEVPFTPTAKWSDTFPHLGFPAEYTQRNRPRNVGFDMFPFWTGAGFEEVEGKIHGVDFVTDSRRYSLHEVRRNLHAMMDQVAGVKVFEGRIPKEAADTVDEKIRQDYNSILGWNWDKSIIEVWRVDRPDGPQIWIVSNPETMSAGWVVAEPEGFVQTSALLPADALKKQLDADGRVAIQVNFAVDKADILPDSQPQLDQVLALLQQDANLSLAVEGHTDNTGTAAHNRSLSEARAKSVVSALAGKGIAVSRLSAAGFGQERAVADNATGEGRAKNRRVELVKQP